MSGFLSRLSVLGLILAGAVLLAVLSVMNGFEQGMRERILGMLPHVTVRGYADLEAWQQQQQSLATTPGVSGSYLFHEQDALLIQGSRVHAARWLGLGQETIAEWRAFFSHFSGELGQHDVLLGRGLASQLSVQPGDRLRLVVAPEPNQSAPQLPQVVKVVGVLDSGTELDERLLIGRFVDVLPQTGEYGGGTGLALKLADVFASAQMRRLLGRQLPDNFYTTDWTGTHGNLYAAIELSRDLVTLLLLSIIAVAAFNVVSSLVLLVTDRTRAIAALRALGASANDVATIFLLQGLYIGVVGASVGALLGWGLAELSPHLAKTVESALGHSLLNTDVYPLNYLPVSVQVGDVLTLWIASVSLCVLAAVLPARRAARIPVASVLSQGQ